MAATGSNDGRSRYTAVFFEREEDLLAATTESRLAGFEIHDVYTPYAVHGLDVAMGLRRSHLTWVAFLAGGLGLSFGLGLQIWTSVYDWPLNVGGKPFNSFPLFIPVAFELTVIFSGLLAIAVLFVHNRLWLFSRKKIFPRATDDRFVLVLHQRDASFDVGRARRIFEQHHSLEIIEGDQFV